jgi:hypothetical protein
MSGCFVDLDPHRRHYDDGYYDDGPGFYTSFLSVYWTVDGSTDPGACRDFGASDISILVERQSGETVGEYTSACRDFQTSIELDPGRYYANAVLLGRNEEITTAVDIDPFSLGSDDELSVDIDFPAGSFF